MSNVPVSPSADARAALELLESLPESIRAEVLARLATGPVAGPPATAVPWATFRPLLEAQYVPQLRSVATRRLMMHAMRALEELGVETTADLNVHTLTRLVTTRDPSLSPNSVRGLLRCVSAICGHAHAFGFLPVNPFLARPIRTWIRGVKPRGIKHLSRAQIRNLLDVLAADVRDKRGWAQYRARRLEALVTLVAWTGLRRGEALHVQLEDIDLDAGVLFVVSRAAHRLKTPGSEAILPIMPPAANILRDWFEHRLDAPEGFARAESPWLFPNLRVPTPWVNGPMGTKPLERLRAVGKRAGIENASFQMLRRSVATHLEGAGAGSAMVQRILRHSNLSTTQNYYMKADLINMREAMRDFGY